MFLLSQCSEKKCGRIAPCDKTLHLLCHFGRTTVKDARETLLPDFVATNWDWVEQVGGHILERKGLDVRDYCGKLITGAIPFDELGVLIFARAANIHVGIFHSNRYWYTNRNQLMNCWNGMLFYNGRMEFFDVLRNKILDMKVSLKMLGRTIDGNRRSEVPKPPPPEQQPKRKPPHQPQVTPSNRPPLISQPTRVPRAAPKKPEDPEYVPPGKIEYNLRKRKPSAAAGSARDLEAQNKEDRKSDEEEPVAKKRTSRTSQRAGYFSSLSQVPLGDNLNSDQDKNDENNLNGAGKSPNSNDAQNNLNGAARNPNSPAKKTFEIKTHGLKRTVVKERSFKCMDCKEVFPKIKDLNHHITEKHKEAFKCDQCSKVFGTANGLTKHKGSHSGFNLKCAVCGVIKQFQHELTEHMRTHTGTGLFPCDFKSEDGVGCRLRFISKRTMLQHKEVHSFHHYHCNPCKKDYKTKSLLYQHQRSVHKAGGGYKAYCGTICPNSSSRKRHQDSCDTCQEQKPFKKYKS